MLPESSSFFKSLKVFYLSFLVVFGIGSTNAKNYYFEHVLTPNSKPIKNVRSISEDNHGFLWLAGDEGVFRYDGHELVELSNEPTNRLFISSNDDIWVDGVGVLTRYSSVDYSPKRFNKTQLGHEKVSIGANYQMVILTDGRKVFANRHGINIHDAESDQFVAYKVEIPEKDNANNLTSRQVSATQIYPISENQFLLGTNTGLFISDLKLNKNSQIQPHTTLIQKSRITQITKMLGNRVLIGSNNGLYILNEQYEIESHYPCLQESPCDNHREITQLLVDSANTIWIGSSNGLYIIESGSKEIINLKHNSQKSGTISNNLVTDLHQDRLGNIIVATYSGIDYFNRQSIHITKNPDIESQNIDINNVWSIQADSEKLWLGTFGSGLYNISKGAIRNFSVDIKRVDSISSNRIPELFTDSTGKLWVGTNNGLQLFDAQEERFLSYPIKNASVDFSSQGVFSIAEDEDGNIWLTTSTGFAKVSTSSGQVAIWSKDNLPSLQVEQWIRSIYPLSREKILVGSDKGLQLFSPGEEAIDLVAADYFLKVLQDSQGNIWALAINGLYLFDQENDTVKKMELFSTPESMVNSSQSGCNAMQEDDFFQMWLVCNNGLEVFDLATKQFIKRVSLTGNDDMEDFLTGSSSFVKDSNGFLLAGMRSGIYRWAPLKITNSEQAPNVKISRIIYTYSDKKSINHAPFTFYQPALDETAIELSHTLQTVEFRFSVPGTPYNPSTQFQHRLRGYSNQWVNSGDTNYRAVYQNLAASDYVFEVRAKFRDSNWEKKEFKFSIKQTPWLRWWALGLYSLAIFITITFIVRIRTHQLAKGKRKLRKTVVERTHELAISKKNIETLMQEKEKMIEDIYHQTKTPLQLMLGNLNFLSNSRLTVEQFAKKQTDEIFKLSRLTEQALRISQSDTVEKNEEKENVYLLKHLTSLMLCYCDIAKTLQLNFNWHIDELLTAYCYPELIESLVGNLLSNAMKYTKRGNISLSIRRRESFIDITCNDTGIGISDEELSSIFSRHHRAVKSSEFEGAGIGLAIVKYAVEKHLGTIEVESMLSVGSKFKVTLPLEMKVTDNFSRKNSQGIEQFKTLIQEESTEHETSDIIHQVLIVEDNIELAVYLKELLNEKFSIINALNGQDALDKAIDWVPDIILTDVMMGAMNGYQLCREVRSNPITSHIPLIMLTAKSDPESRVAGFKAGANDFLTKPFDETLLINRINNQLEHASNIRKATINAHQTAVRTSDDKLITRFLCYVEQNYQNNELLIKDICKALHVSVRQLERKVRFFIDMTPNEYLNEYRLLRARDKLRSGHKIHSTFEDCGFSSQAYFSRRYKQRFSHPPSQEVTKTTGESVI